MELDNLTVPFACGQLNIWLAEQTSYAGMECQRGLFARVKGRVDPDLREHVNSQALQEDEQLGAVFLRLMSSLPCLA